MLKGYPPVIQTLLGTGLTWSVTALGALLCFIVSNSSNTHKHIILDGSLGFSAGIMLAASFWSLLDPALEIAMTDLQFGDWAVIPVSFGFLLGASFVALAEYCLPAQWFQPPDNSTAVCDPQQDLQRNVQPVNSQKSGVRLRHVQQNPGPHSNALSSTCENETRSNLIMTRRLWLLLIAITVHNIPEGLAVGIAFGSVTDHLKTVTFSSARNLAIGIAIQNFPEGLAVSLPLHSSGYGFFKSFWYGQLSGLVEPFAGVVGCLAVQFSHQLQPYALGFAAGAMVFVVLDDVLPEAQSRGNGRLCSIFGILGFVLMMCMDVVTTPG